MYKYLFKSLLSILLGDIYPETELLDHRVVLCLNFWGTTRSLQWLHYLYSHQQYTSFPISPHSSNNACCFFDFVCLFWYSHHKNWEMAKKNFCVCLPTEWCSTFPSSINQHENKNLITIIIRIWLKCLSRMTNCNIFIMHRNGILYIWQ